jgi:hypothetical protein
MLAFAALGLEGRLARAQTTTNEQNEAIEEPVTPQRGNPTIPDSRKNPMAGSVLFFEQELSTQTAQIEPSPELSYVPFYAWWFSLRPRWNFNDHVRVQARFDYTKELTNSEETTLLHEDVFGDIWTDLVVEGALPRAKNTRLMGGARLIWPTSLVSQGAGVYVKAGLFGGVSQEIVFKRGAQFFPSARVGARAIYLHTFSDATTPTNYGGFAYTRQNVDEFSFSSDQISGQTLVHDELDLVAEGGLQIIPKLELVLDFVVLQQWHYAPTDTSVATQTGPVFVPRIGDNQTTDLVWEIAALDYDVIPEMSLSLGYYNLTNEIAPDGTLRGPFTGGEGNLFWSPEARVFFTITGKLDRIWDDVAGKLFPSTPPSSMAASR